LIRPLAMLLLLLVITMRNYAQSSTQEDLFSLDNRLKFADRLYSEKDFLRAIGEYKEILKMEEIEQRRNFSLV